MIDTQERTYHDFIREVREAAGWTQGQAADRLGVARQTWNGWEQGTHVPLPMFCRVIEKLGTDFRVPRPPARPNKKVDNAAKLALANAEPA